MTINAKGGLIILLFLSFLSFLCSKSSATVTTDKILKIAILDSGFCPKKINNDSIKLFPIVDLTNSNPEIDCQKFNWHDKIFHGQWVLETLLSNFTPKKIIIHIHPYLIFDKNRNQNINYWTKALKQIKKDKINFLLLATGYNLGKNDKNTPLFDFPSFLSSPTIGGSISTSSSVWPQQNSINTLLIGSYYPGIKGNFSFKNKGLLYDHKIDYYFDDHNNDSPFHGTSKAVAIAMRRALQLCPDEFLKDISEVKKCLASKRKILYFYQNINEKKIHFTF